MPRRILPHRVLAACGGAALFVGALLAASVALAQYNPHPRIYLTPERIQRIRTQHWQAGSYEWGQLMTAAARTDLDGAKAQALAYAITGDEDWATTALGIMRRVMADTPVPRVNFNTVGRTFNTWALCFDWLYGAPQFTDALKQQVIAYLAQIPETGDGKWNWYPDGAYFNGVSKCLWGPPVWGLATWGDNPQADHYIDNGYSQRWLYIRNTLGFGPANLAVVRGGCMPQGMDYGAGTMANIVRWLAAWKSATGQDLFDEGPALRQYLAYFPQAYYYTEDFIRRPEHGHNAHKRGAYLHNAVAALLVLMDEYADSEEARWASWWVHNIEGADRYPGNDSRYFAEMDLIFSDNAIPQTAPFDQPLAYYAEGNGMWICRSNWTQGATEPTTFATFRAGNWTWFNQNHWDQGNFCIYSHGEDLLVDGGVYDGGGDVTVINYHHQTIAHNSLLIKDPRQTKGWHFYDWTLDGFENSGGQNRPWRETLPDAVLDGARKDPRWPQSEGSYVHDMADIERKADNPRYTYAYADLTNAYANPRWEEDYAASRLADVDYRPKVGNVTRQWFYLRPRADDADEYFVTFDRVSSTDASFQKTNLLHFIGEPVFTNGGLVDSEVPGHIETYAADRFTMALGGAVLHGATVLPADPRIRKVGGEGYEYWVNGTNYDPFPDAGDENPLGGVWRLEIMPPTAERDDLFLNVLHPDWRGAPAPTVTRIPGDSCEGAAFDGWVLMFAKEEAAQSALGYSVDMDGAQRHLLCDMDPGYAYRVFRNGGGAPLAVVPVGADGILEFESPGGGSFQVSRGDAVPDLTPPSGNVRIGSADLTPPSGSYTVYARYGDALGNWSDPPLSDTVLLDLPAADDLPPEVWSLAPADGATGVDPRSNVACLVRDLGSDVDTTNVELRVNGVAVPRRVLPVGGRYLVVGNPPAILAENTTYGASVTAADLAEPPNGVTVSWDFSTGTLADETQPPSPPTDLTAAVNGDCDVSVGWSASAEAGVIAYRVAYGEWPDGSATDLEWQTEIGVVIAGLPDGEYWLGASALDNVGQESALATLGRSLVVDCGGMPGTPGQPGNPDLDGLARGEIYPPGVIVAEVQPPLSVANLGQGWVVRIFTVSGRLVEDFHAETDGEDFTWDLLNREGSRVAKGLYLVRVFDDGGGTVREGYYLNR